MTEIPQDATAPLWVIVPAYNEARWIGGVLSALAAQTDLDFALVVVDHASTDGTGELVRVVREENLVVENSLRRLRAWGPRRALLWHWDRRYLTATTAQVHVR